MVSHRAFLKSGSVCGAAALAALVATHPVYAGGVNLLVNPGFEAPASGSTAANSNIAGWTPFNSMFRAQFNQNGGTPPHPTPDTSDWALWARTFEPIGGGATQDVANISAGATYELSAVMFFEAGFLTIIDPVAARLGMTFLDAGNNPIGTPNFLDITAASMPHTGGWDPYSFSAVAPAGAAKVRVFAGWDGGGPGQGGQSVMIDNLFLDGPGVPPTNFWVVDGSGDWNVGGNWALGSVPNGQGAEAEFLSAITSAQTVFTNAPVTVGSMRFDNANTYVISGAGSITMDVAAGSGSINVATGSHKINLPLHLADNVTANVSGGATLNIADPLILNGNTLTKAGTGVLLIEAPVRSTAAAGIAATGGETRINFGIGTPASPGNPAQAQTAVTVSGPAKVVFGANQTLRGLDAVTANAGDQEIDLGGNVVRVYSANLATTEQGIYDDVRAARNSASGRDGIYDSGDDAGNTFAVGMTDQATDANGAQHVLVRLTRSGDATVDGLVNLADFNRLAANFGATNALWDQGDFDFNTIVNLADFNLLAANFGLSASADGPTPDDWSNLASAVPEPASLSLLALAAVPLLRRRRSA